MEGELVCNFAKCRKRLDTEAWVTSCSHIFCQEDGDREFRRAFICPACQTSLSGNYDIISVDLQPSEQYKSMALAGQKPEVIMEVCSRALSFWTYQNQQERMYQEYITNKTKEKTLQQEKYYEGVVANNQSELTYLKNYITTARKELEAMKEKVSDVSNKLAEKNRLYQKLQFMYDASRRKNLTPADYPQPGQSGDIAQQQNVSASARRRSMFLSHTGNPGGNQRMGTTMGQARDLSSPPEREFVLRPNNTPMSVDLTGMRSRMLAGDLRSRQNHPRN